MSETKKKLNDNDVTEVTFLGGRVAVIFSFSFGPLGEPVSGLSLWPSWLWSTITGKLFGLWPRSLQRAGKKLLHSSASRQWEIQEPDRLLNIQAFPPLLVSYGGLIMFIPALASFPQPESRCCVAFELVAVVLRGKTYRTRKKKIQHFFPINFILPLPFLSPLLFQQMSSLFLQWLALEGHIHFSSKCTRPKCFECLPKDNNKIHHADLRNELPLNRSSRRDKGNRGSQHGFCQYAANSSNYIKPPKSIGPT